MLIGSTAAAIMAAIERAAAEGHHALSEPESKALLSTLGIPVPAGRLVRTPGDAAAAVDEIGAPVVVKAVSSVLTHKSEAGGIVFPVESGATAEEACKAIAARVQTLRPDVILDGFLIEAFRPTQPEWILGLRIDPLFGPAIMFGLGGMFVEVLRQVSFRLAPLREEDIEALLTERPAMRILAGVRGAPSVDREGLKGAIRALSDLAACSEIIEAIAEIEINPLTITEQGVLALDALVVLRSRES